MEYKTNMDTTIKEFKAYLDRIYMFSGAMSLMGFDAQTIAPKGGIAARAKREGFFAQEVFAMTTSDTMKGFLDKLTLEADNLDPITFAMYRRAQKAYDQNIKIPPEMVGKFSELTSTAYVVWEAAKENNDFASFAPYLKELVAMTKEMLKNRQEGDDLP